MKPHFQVPDKKVPDKAIVFSQWTAMLDVLETPLRRAGLEFRRLVRSARRRQHPACSTVGLHGESAERRRVEQPPGDLR